MATPNEEFIKKLFDLCDTRQEWLTVARFGLDTLLEEKHLFIDILIHQAYMRAEKKNPEDIAFELSHLFNDLQLGFKEES
jgi:hypothetical protein